jgi:hypothetical protein
MLNAAENQGEFYSEMWRSDQARLYDQFLMDANCTEFDCRKDAFDRSIKDATGSSMCNVNIGASAWFWFIVMTTVGYGNQSPVTREGRYVQQLLNLLRGRDDRSFTYIIIFCVRTQSLTGL